MNKSQDNPKIGVNKMHEIRKIIYDHDDDDNLKYGEVDLNKSERRIYEKYKWCHKLNKWVLEFCALSCLVDLFATQALHPAKITGSKLSFLWTKRSFEMSQWGHRARCKLWPYLIPLVWFACALHISFYLYYKYAYDYYSFKLARIRWWNETTNELSSSSSSRDSEMEGFWVEQLERRERDLKQLGAHANMKRRYIVQCTYLHIMSGSFTLYFITCVYFNFITPFDFYTARNIFDYAQERALNCHFVRKQVEKLSQSIGQWTSTLLNSRAEMKTGRVISPNGVGLIDIVSIKESQLCQQLDWMLTSGRLQPLNQRPKWVESWSPYLASIILSTFVYQFFTGATIFYLQVYLLDIPLKELTAKEWLIYLELLYMLLIIQLCVDLYAVTLFFTCWDQAALVKKLRQMLKLVIEKNNHVLKLSTQFSKSSAARRTTQANQMNRDILLVLMHYRIFVAQLMKLKQPLGIITFTSLCVMFTMPILGRLHVPYFQVETMQSMRLLIVLICCAILAPADIHLIPVCYLNKRCIDFYTDLNSLLAHVTQISLDRSDVDTHDRHILISLLRKELAHHDQATRQLTINFLGIKFTYDNLIRLHFYVGFIILSIMGENLAQLKDRTGTIFTDPLDLF